MVVAYDELAALHAAVDRLKPQQAEAVQAFVNSVSAPLSNSNRPRVRKLKFASSGGGPLDLALKADSYLAGFGED